MRDDADDAPGDMSNDNMLGLPLAHGAVVTVGTFDGVHPGHRDVLAQVAARGRELSLPGVVVTFEPHPLEVVNPDAAPRLLTTHAEKLELFAQTGIDYAAVVPFTPALARLEAREFVTEILVARYRLRELFVGYDHGFGRGRLGDSAVLRQLGGELGFAVHVLSPVATEDGVRHSSTAVRAAVAAGDLGEVQRCLGRFYSVSGRVIGGDRRGRLLGYPTLNIESPHERKLLPPDGVYAVRVETPQGSFGGMLNLGPRPTFGDQRRSIEAHVFDASHDWYGAMVRIDFVQHLRETRAFSGIEALTAQLGVDEEAARRALSISSMTGSARLS